MDDRRFDDGIDGSRCKSRLELRAHGNAGIQQRRTRSQIESLSSIESVDWIQSIDLVEGVDKRLRGFRIEKTGRWKNIDGRSIKRNFRSTRF